MTQITPLKSTALQYLIDLIASLVGGPKGKITQESQTGRVFYARIADPSGVEVLNSADVIIADNGTYSIWGLRLAPLDDLETETIKKDSNGRWWALLFDEHQLPEMPVLKNIDGTSDAITAEWPPNMPSNAHFLSGKLFAFRPNHENMGNPQITINGITRELRDIDLSFLPSGFLKPDHQYLFITDGVKFARLLYAPENHKERCSERISKDGNIDMPSPIISTPPERATFYGPFATDTFETINGLKAPSLTIDYAGEKVGRVIDLHLILGQSLADSMPSDMPLYWRNGSPWRWHTFMPNDTSANEQRGGMRGWSGLAAPGATGLVHAKNNVYPNVSGVHDQTQYSSDVWAQALNFYSSYPPRAFICRASSTGGQSFIGNKGRANLGIWKLRDNSLDPSDPNYETYSQTFLNTLQDIGDMYREAVKMGYRVGAVKIMFAHGEADNATPYQTYLDQANGYKADLETRIASIAPELPVIWYVNQAGGSAKGGVGKGNAWQNRIAIADFSRQHDNVIFTIPKYHLRFGTIGGVLDDVHIDAWSNAIVGETTALAEIERELGREWYPPRPRAARIDGNSVIVDFESLEHLVLDPGMCPVRPDMGFILDGDIRATNVRVTGPRQVTVTFPRTPQTGVDALQYAYRTVAADESDNQGYPIGTGALRDNYNHASILFPGIRIYRPAEAFRIPL